MVRVIKNPLDQADHKELEKVVSLLFDNYKERHDKWNSKSPSLPSVMPDWEDWIGRKRLMEIFEKGKLIDTAKDRHFPEIPWKGEPVYEAQKAITEVLSKCYGTKVVKRNRAIWYNPTNFMGWHTNFRVPGTRIYLLYSTEENQSFFRYYNRETDEIITDYDDKGLTVRQFEVTDEDPLWHCVGCGDCNRLSCGFMLL